MTERIYPCPIGFDPEAWDMKTTGEKASWYEATGYVPPVMYRTKADKPKPASQDTPQGDDD